MILSVQNTRKKIYHPFTSRNDTQYSRRMVIWTNTQLFDFLRTMRIGGCRFPFHYFSDSQTKKAWMYNCTHTYVHMHKSLHEKYNGQHSNHERAHRKSMGKKQYRKCTMLPAGKYSETCTPLPNCVWMTCKLHTNTKLEDTLAHWNQCARHVLRCFCMIRPQTEWQTSNNTFHCKRCISQSAFMPWNTRNGTIRNNNPWLLVSNVVTSGARNELFSNSPTSL